MNDGTEAVHRRRSGPHLELRLLPIAVALIVVATAIPTEWRSEAAWNATLGVIDIIQNLVLYVPLGLALRRRPVWQTFAFAGTISLLIETGQLWQVGRFASPVDLVINIAGAVVTVLAYRDLIPTPTTIVSPYRPVIVRVSLTAALAMLATLIVIVGWGTSSRQREAAALSTWDASYPLLLGNEATSGRAWRGTISSLRLLASPWKPWSTPVAPLYESSQPVVLRGGPAVRLPDEASRRFAAAATSADAFTVMLSVTTADVGQVGPARLVTFSSDTLNRNFDVGQEARRLVFRVRTPLSGLNGEEHRAESGPVLEAGRPVQVVATYDGAVARIYVDGALSGRSNIGAAACRVSVLCDSSEPAVWGTGGGLLMVVALLILPGMAARPIGLTMFGAGVVAALLTFLLPALWPGAVALNCLEAFLGATCVWAARPR